MIKKRELRALTLSRIINTPFFLIAIPAFFYIQGRSFEDGYLSHFGAHSSHFESSIPDQYWNAVDLFNNLFSWIEKEAVPNLGKIISSSLLTIIIIIISAAMLFATTKLLIVAWGKTPRINIPDNKFITHELPIITLIPTAAVYALLLVTLLSTAAAFPAYKFGLYTAKNNEIKNNFPTASLSESPQEEELFSIIKCDSKKCLIQQGEQTKFIPFTGKLIIHRKNNDRQISQPTSPE